MKRILFAIVFFSLCLGWLRFDNQRLRKALVQAQQTAAAQTQRLNQLTTAFKLANARAERNAQAQVALRQKMQLFAEREIVREQRIARLYNENKTLRQWGNTPLPDVVRQLHKRAACASAARCLQQLPTSDIVPDARQRASH